MSLPNGHYKLFVKQNSPAAPGGEKHKVFWVECGAAGGTTTNGGTTTGTTTTTGTGTTTTTTNGTFTTTRYAYRHDRRWLERHERRRVDGWSGAVCRPRAERAAWAT